MHTINLYMLNVDDATSQRHLAINGTHNVRDLGGYTTRDGSHTRWRTLLRSDHLYRLSMSSRQALIDIGIHTVLDLRYTIEMEFEPDDFATSPVVHYIPMPLYELNGNGALPAVPDNLEEMYRMILDHRQEQIVRIFRALFAPGALPSLFHCTAGKDRTGLIAALILGAVDVPEETIVEDYALSAQYLDLLLDQLRKQARLMGYDAEWYDRLLICQPDTMRHTLKYLAQRYVNVPAYL
ncbi:MAG TPA: tyrosine-protein phosphatase, partial [Anaerolineae bacterium]